MSPVNQFLRDILSDRLCLKYGTRFTLQQINIVFQSIFCLSGIAMGSGTDVAIETSDVVLMNSNFSNLPHALGLVKATANNMKQNIVISVGVVLVLLTSVFFSEWMNMSIGMLVHEGSI